MTNVLLFTNNSHFVPFTIFLNTEHTTLEFWIINVTFLGRQKATDGNFTKTNKLMDGLKEQICVDTLCLCDVLTIGPGKPSPFGPSGPNGPGSPRSP